MEDSNDTAKIVIGLLAGAIIGGIFGVLFAPDKGSETLRKLVSGVKDLSEDLKSKVMSETDKVNAEEETV